MARRNEIDLTSGPIFPTVLRYTLPIVATSILSLLFNAADLIVVGQFCGGDSVAAVGSTTSLINLFINLFLGLSTGAGILLAQAIGAKRDCDISDILHTSFLLSAVAGAILTVIGVSMARIFLVWMGSPAEVLNLSTVYLRFYFAGILPMLVYDYGAALLRAMGDTFRPMIYLTLGGAINLVLNVIFVAVFRMDVAGVGLATALSHTVSAVLTVRTFLKRNDAFRVRFSGLRVNRRVLGKVVGLGLPIGLRSSVFSLSNVLIQSSVNALGAATMAGCAAASSINDFTDLTMNAFAVTSMNTAGQCLGAGKMKRVRQTLLVCMFYIFAANLVMGIPTVLFSRQLLSIYIPNDTEAVEIGRTVVIIITALFFLGGWMNMFSYTISGLGHSLTTTIISLVGAVALRLAFVFFLFPIPVFHNVVALKLNYPVSWFATVIVQCIFFIFIYKKTCKKLKTV